MSGKKIYAVIQNKSLFVFETEANTKEVQEEFKGSIVTQVDNVQIQHELILDMNKQFRDMLIDEAKKNNLHNDKTNVTG